MQITDKDRLDFLERWIFQEYKELLGLTISRTQTQKKNGKSLYIFLDKDHTEKEIYANSVREAIDNAIIATQEKKK